MLVFVEDRVLGSVQGNHRRMFWTHKSDSIKEPAWLLSCSHQSPIMTQTQRSCGAHARGGGGGSRPGGVPMAGGQGRAQHRDVRFNYRMQELKLLLRARLQLPVHIKFFKQRVLRMCQGGAGPARARLVGGEGGAQRGPGRAGRERPLQRRRAGAGVRTHQLAGRDIIVLDAWLPALPLGMAQSSAGVSDHPGSAQLANVLVRQKIYWSVGVSQDQGSVASMQLKTRHCQKVTAAMQNCSPESICCESLQHGLLLARRRSCRGRGRGRWSACR